MTQRRSAARVADRPQPASQAAQQAASLRSFALSHNLRTVESGVNMEEQVTYAHDEALA